MSQEFWDAITEKPRRPATKSGHKNSSRQQKNIIKKQPNIHKKTKLEKQRTLQSVSRKRISAGPRKNAKIGKSQKKRQNIKRRKQQKEVGGIYMLLLLIFFASTGFVFGYAATNIRVAPQEDQIVRQYRIPSSDFTF